MWKSEFGLDGGVGGMTVMALLAFTMRQVRVSPEAVGRAARFACDEVVRLPERKARTPKGPQGAERWLQGCKSAAGLLCHFTVSEGSDPEKSKADLIFAASSAYSESERNFRLGFIAKTPPHSNSSPAYFGTRWKCKWCPVSP